MEKRIKTLYIFTIVATITFLGMQVYWLYSRYEASLCEQEDRIFSEIKVHMDEYFDKRQFHREYMTSYSLHHLYDSVGYRSFQADIVWYDSENASRIPQPDLFESEEEWAKRKEEFLSDNIPLLKKSYDASNAPSEGEVWTAMKKVDIEFGLPMTEQRMDSMMSGIGINGKSRLFVTDSMVWNYSLQRHTSMIHPTAKVVFPYSELERKSTEIEVSIPVGYVLNGMLGTLAVAVILSCFLILCLVSQIATVMKLSRLDRMRSSFITTMIHELKRPIFTLKMCVSGLENERMMEDSVLKKEIMVETRQALDNLSAYFSKLRDITFNNVEQIPLNIQSVRLRDFVDDVVSTISFHAGKRVEFVNEIDEALEVSADPSHLYNILNNLAENAVKYSGDTVKIKAAAFLGSGNVEFSICDTGNGISPGDIKHIFKRFYRGKAGAGDQPGMGLGLAYVKLLVEAHGGEISVESEEGMGTCFTIKLPQ